MTDAVRHILVTHALPYANGPIHLGHMIEAVQTDVWVRFQRARGHRCQYFCADDAHGTPIMLRAQAEGITPEALIGTMLAEHQRDFTDFLVDYTHYHTTHSDENRELVRDIYRRLREAGLISQRTIRQAYDEEAGMFLPDRFIRGTCPNCGAPDQYGDSCEVCGATYAPTDLIDPVSVLSGKPPVERDSEHHFFNLGAFADTLQAWMAQETLQPAIRNKLQEWFEAGLQDWDISRDAPYWGFEIPDAPGKFFYVWMDAPVGYMASHLHHCRAAAENFDAVWGPDSTAEVYHFIGKDIAYFHTLFWPAVLKGAGHRLPSAVFVHGFLTVDGQKMSKSRGTFILARKYLEILDPEYLRYYFAAKLTAGVEDIDLNLEDFVLRINADLVGKFVNIASRCVGFIGKRFNHRLASTLPEPEQYQAFVDAGEEIAQAYEAREYGKAIRGIMNLADRANQYIDSEKPWVRIKDPDGADDVHRVCTQGLNLFRVLATYLAPVLPRTAAKVQAFLKVDSLQWQAIGTPLLDHTIARFEPLLTRIEPKAVEALVAASKQQAPPSSTPTAPIASAAPPTNGNRHLADDPIGDEIDYDAFSKIDLRVAEITAAETVPKADKLLRLTLDIGGETRQVFAGIKQAYPNPDALVGRSVVMVANLKPRKMRFGVSEGMVLAAGPGGEDIFVVGADPGAQAGMRVK